MRTRSTFWNAPQREGILISDLSHCEPQSAISSTPERDRWYTIPYETRDGIEGAMLSKGGVAHPPDVRLPLPVEGWHAIYLGMFLGEAHDRSRLRVKLAGERLFDLLAPSSLGHRVSPKGRVLGRPGPLPGYNTSIEEFLWKAADLDGQDLIISHARSVDTLYSQLAFVRLVPMTKREVREYTGAAGRPDTKLLIAQSDGQVYYGGEVKTVEEIQEIFEPMRDTDVGKFFMGTCGNAAGQTFFPSKVGKFYGEGGIEFVDKNGRATVEAYRGFLSRGIDPLKVAVDHVHSLGIDIYLGFRMGSMGAIPGLWLESIPFWVEHPELRCRDRDGLTVQRLSMAYPEVRRFYVGLFEELLEYGIEGVQLIYTRRPPFVLFEEPVIEEFKRQHGIDPRELPDDPARRSGCYTTDERLMRHWAGYLTQFMRELREMLDKHRRPDGGRLQVAANVSHDAFWNRAGGMDLETWAREGLVDILAPYTGGSGIWQVDFEYFRRVTEGTACLFYEDVTPRCMPGRDYAKRALRAYEGGSAGIALWDFEGRILTKSQWHTVRRLGHREDLKRMASQPAHYHVHPLKSIYDWNPDDRYG